MKQFSSVFTSEEKKPDSTKGLHGVRNFYQELGSRQDPEKNNPNFKIHGIKVPFRMLIVGASGSMKTNSALDVFSKMSNTFVKLIVVCRNEDEPLYQYLKKSIPEEQLDIIEVVGDNLSGLPDINDFDKNENTLVIFDDLCLVKKQGEIEEFFIRARKVGVSCMYLTQSYYSAPKVIRSQCNYILLKKISSTNDLRMILSEYSLQIEVDELKRLYTDCTRNKLDWLMIAIENKPSERFWHNYTKLAIEYPEDEQPEEDTTLEESKQEQNQPYTAPALQHSEEDRAKIEYLKKIFS